MFETLGLIPSDSQRNQLIALLKAADTKSGAFLLTGKRVPLSWLSRDEVEALVLKWKTSRSPIHRQLSAVAITLATTSLYGYPSPEWDRIGYQGPMGPPPKKQKRLKPLDITSDEVMVCDVVIVGSGAGGGCAAGVLAAAGLDVVVLERGGYRAESDYHHYETRSMHEMYLYGATLTTSDLGCRIIAGSTLGGGTVVNYTTSFRAPDFVLKQWADESGIDAFVSGEIEESYDEVSKRVNANFDSSAAGKRDALMEEGLKALGWHVDNLPRAVKGCTQDEQCGFCGFGCRVGAKQNTLKTYLEDAAEHGARIVVNADVNNVIVEDGRATGVEATVGGHKLRVSARAVVAAGGSIETPALLLRSGLRGQVGHNLRLHPGTAAWGFFEEDVRAWEGTLQARYSAEFRHWDGGWGPIFETVPIHPASGAAAFPWFSAQQHRDFMETYRKVSFCAVLARDASAGRVKIGRDGSVRVHYKPNADDKRRITEGVIAAGKVMEAAGATQVNSPHPVPITYQPGQPGGHERWADETRKAGYGKNTTFFSYHQMGSCRMGVDPSRSAIGPNNESHEVNGLYVLDASTFPLASGVNPMLSIYAIANRGAKKLAERLS
jgi:choline dehydrogenase-like flavoprotein